MFYVTENLELMERDSIVFDHDINRHIGASVYE
jgi:hypothetical protein